MCSRAGDTTTLANVRAAARHMKSGTKVYAGSVGANDPRDSRVRNLPDGP